MLIAMVISNNATDIQVVAHTRRNVLLKEFVFVFLMSIKYQVFNRVFSGLERHVTLLAEYL